MALPPCGLYRTSAPIGSVPAGRLVQFHNHGDPGPGVYLPEGWANNRARISTRGTTLSSDEQAHTLVPLPPEGLYLVVEPFFCCAKQCQRFEPDMLVQLGYNGAGDGILFLPELSYDGVHLPERGTRIDDEHLGKILLCKVPTPQIAVH